MRGVDLRGGLRYIQKYIWYIFFRYRGKNKSMCYKNSSVYSKKNKILETGEKLTDIEIWLKNAFMMNFVQYALLRKLIKPARIAQNLQFGKKYFFLCVKFGNLGIISPLERKKSYL